jgi:L-ascorbate metabolism protein UlaG (beta-lactamase superfamily)
MKITKLGHCCLVIKEGDLTILTDPGMFSTSQNKVKGIDIVLITHEHADHYHLESLKEILKNNPKAKVITNSTVGALLEKENISYSIVEEGNKTEEKGIAIEGVGTKHALIHSSIPVSNNTGFFIANKLFYPGDAFTNPKRKVDILALPVAGPWMKISEAVDYALLIKPRVAFPVHDAILVSPGMSHRIPAMVLEKNNITFVPIELNKEMEW